MKQTLTAIIAFSSIFCATIVCQASEDEEAWDTVINLAEALIGEGSVWDAKGTEGKLDALIDLHVAFCTEITGKRIPSQRVRATKQGMRLFLKTAGERYQGDKRRAVLRVLRDLAANRAVFVEILTSDSPSEVIEQQMIAYLERNQGMSYDDPVPIPGQVSVPQADTPLQIIEGGVRLVSDCGTSGHYNKAIDAGEVIKLNISLKNISDDPFRSTSGFLQTEDKYVRVGKSEVLYTERSEIGGQTVTFAPGKSITPSQHFVLTLSPNCPDGHEIECTLLAWDSDRGKHEIPFEITVWNVGPLAFGAAEIDDDIPGRSDGNGNQLIEVGETIEYVLAVRNQGQVDIDSIECTLFSSEPALIFKSGDDILRYSSIPQRSEKPIPANFVFTVQEEGNSDLPGDATLRLFSTGGSRGHQYSWITVSQISIAIDAERNKREYDKWIAQAQASVKEGDLSTAVKLYEKAQDYTDQSLQERISSLNARIEDEEKLKKFNDLLAYAKARNSRQAGKEALKVLAKALALYPDNTEALTLQKHISRYYFDPDNVISNSIGMKFVWIPPGEYMMGTPSRGKWGFKDDRGRPQHRVQISKGFYMGIYEVTQAQYQAIMGRHRSHFRGSNLPVDEVSWNNASEFCRKLSQKEGRVYRLPTEAEWEYACRAGTQTIFPFGNSESKINEYAWCGREASGKTTHPVGQKKPNAFGLYDMMGNVGEWCQDWYAVDYYNKTVQLDPQGPSSGQYRVYRGGGWNSPVYHCLPSTRMSGHNMDFINAIWGFRVCLLD